MPVFALLVISKAGSLIYHRTFTSSGGSGSGGTGTTSGGTFGLPGTSALTTNDWLVLAGTFHGVHAITRSLTPRLPPSSSSSSSSEHSSRAAAAWSWPEPGVPASGLDSLESSFFRLTVHQTATGTKFLLFTDPSMAPATTATIVRGVYDRYADHVCKNPFWQMEMPIRLDGWDREIGRWLTQRKYH